MGYKNVRLDISGGIKNSTGFVTFSIPDLTPQNTIPCKHYIEFNKKKKTQHYLFTTRYNTVTPERTLIIIKFDVI